MFKINACNYNIVKASKNVTAFVEEDSPFPLLRVVLWQIDRFFLVACHKSSFTVGYQRSAFYGTRLTAVYFYLRIVPESETSLCYDLPECVSFLYSIVLRVKIHSPVNPIKTC